MLLGEKMYRINFTVIACAALCASILSLSINAEDALIEKAETYLQKNSNKGADQSWVRDFHERAGEAMSDNASMSLERYASDKALEFFYDKRKALLSPETLHVTDKIEVARWYVLYFDKGW